MVMRDKVFEFMETKYLPKIDKQIEEMIQNINTHHTKTE